MKIIDKSVRVNKFSNIAVGTVFKLDNEYFIKIESVYDGANQFYRNAISLIDYKGYTFDSSLEVYPYYNVSLLLKN